MFEVLGYGIDVSHHQDPASLPWESFRGHVNFVIVRASYGIRIDGRAKEHARCAREIGAKVGLYTFFRPGEPWMDQARALELVADSVKLEPGDLVPALDVEDDPFSKPPEVSKGWGDACEKIVDAWTVLYGDAMVYISQRGWSMLGKPEWVLHKPLWVPNYRVVKPASPAGMLPTIWQHRVDVFESNGPSTAPEPEPHGAVDQNRLLKPLPLIGYRPSEEDRAKVAALVFETLRQGVQEAPTDPSELDPDPDVPLV